MQADNSLNSITDAIVKINCRAVGSFLFCNPPIGGRFQSVVLQEICNQRAVGSAHIVVYFIILPVCNFLFLLYMHRTYGSYYIFCFFINELKLVVTILTEATPLCTWLRIVINNRIYHLSTLHHNILHKRIFAREVCIKMKPAAFFSKFCTFYNKISHRNHIS